MLLAAPDPRDIIAAFKRDEAIELYRKGKMIDLLDELNMFFKIDMAILETWKNLFSKYRHAVSGGEERQPGNSLQAKAGIGEKFL